MILSTSREKVLGPEKDKKKSTFLVFNCDVLFEKHIMIDKL